MWESKKGTEEFIVWKENNGKDCDIYHSKSSGAMESAGAQSFFQLSVNKYNIRYALYIGDGDTESFKKVIESKRYGDDLIPCKLECVCHVQKRLWRRLRKLQNNMKWKKMSDGKGILGKGRLTDKFINKMQNCYGMTIRQNTLSSQNNDKEKALYSMKKSVLGTLWHCTDMPDNQERYAFCPRESNSWCKYWHNGGNKDYKSSVNSPKVIKDLLVPIFSDLRDDNLLSQCLEGITQNPNEAFNQIIWKKCPKDIFISRHVLEIGVASAVINFNDGVMGLSRIFQSRDLPFGKYSMECASDKDTNRIIKMDKKTQEINNNIRKKKGAIRKGYIDRENEQEGGESCISGSF